MLILPQGITPSNAALGALGVMAAPALAWFVQPLVSARTYRRRSFESEDFFWGVGRGGEKSNKEAFPVCGDPPSKTLSVIVPAHNEEDRLPGMLKDTFTYLNTRRKTADSSFTYEVIVVDDGSTDGTAAEVYRWVERLGTDVVRLLTLKENQGKGAAVGKGMLRMRGKYGLMVDADAATEIQDLDRLLIRMRDVETTGVGAGVRGAAVGEGGPGKKHGLVVGSRAHMEGEAVAKRALHRTILMFVFHWCVSILCTRTIKDTQCGFKLFTRDTAVLVFSSLHLQRWAFDIELIYICQLMGVPMAEVAVNWREVPGSKLIRSKLDVITTSATMLRDMMCVRLCYVLGVWAVAEQPSGEGKKRR
ncbi:GT2 [Ectocarpus sp. CCAP 1310/34]|nr:GT2 [Ectocarpus sp. CCAP 1310/34]